MQDEDDRRLLDLARRVHSMRAAQEAQKRNPLMEEKRKNALDHEKRIDKQVKQIIDAAGRLPFGEPQ